MSKFSSKARTRRRRLLAASVSAAMVSAPQAQAFERVVVGVERFIFCADLLLTDPKKHAENCLPSRVPPDFFKWDSSSGSGTFVAPPPPPPVAVAPPPPAPPVVVAAEPVDCGPVDCGPTDCGPTDCGPADCGPRA